MHEQLIQITSGKGPAECERVVYLLSRLFMHEAEKAGLTCELLEEINGQESRTLLSALIRVHGPDADVFCRSWEGSIQWIAQSPFRPTHKRKNWFAGITLYAPVAAGVWKDTDVHYETLRSSGPGGQHVNKTESAVRATHRPSGLSVTASDERSQHLNKKAATERLKAKLAVMEGEKLMMQQQAQWMEHQLLERGNAVKVFREKL
ncbi:MAG: peptide chain release factor H [Bacteroidia bacterium]|jgi:peptide chain release factor|nr:peptide chain release factor H [Bacteroidia bacterium]